MLLYEILESDTIVKVNTAAVEGSEKPVAETLVHKAEMHK